MDFPDFSISFNKNKNANSSSLSIFYTKLLTEACARKDRINTEVDMEEMKQGEKFLTVIITFPSLHFAIIMRS